MKTNDLSTHIAATYRTLRLALVIIGFALPPLLALGYSIATNDWQLQESLSQYYWAGGGVVRSWFVGLLFAVGALLFVYHGFTAPEDYALNFAGVFALGVAIFPMPLEKRALTFHGFCAISFFVSIAYVCIFQASATLSLIKDKKRRERYRSTYKTLGIAMATSPVAAFALSVIPWLRGSRVFFVEAAGVYVFALYWLVKSREIWETQADHKAARGKLHATQSAKLSDAFRELPVRQVAGSDSRQQS
jgi:hypothetical protein